MFNFLLLEAEKAEHLLSIKNYKPFHKRFGLLFLN